MKATTILATLATSLPLIFAAPTSLNSTSTDALATRGGKCGPDQPAWLDPCIPEGQFQGFDEENFGGNRHIFEVPAEARGDCQKVRDYWYDHANHVESVVLGPKTQCVFYSDADCNSKYRKGELGFQDKGRHQGYTAVSMKISPKGTLYGGWWSINVNKDVESFKCSLN